MVPSLTTHRSLSSLRDFFSAESKVKMGDFYFYKRDNFRAARVFYNEAITAYPESAVAAKAKARLAEVEAKASGQPAPAAAAGAAPAKKKRFFFF